MTQQETYLVIRFQLKTKNYPVAARYCRAAFADCGLTLRDLATHFSTPTDQFMQFVETNEHKP